MDDEFVQRDVIDADVFNNTAKGHLKDGKTVTAQFRMQHHGQPAINRFVFDDGSELCENDDGARCEWVTENEKSGE